MKGNVLNNKRLSIIQSLASLLEEAKIAANNAENNYYRFDEYDEYKNDYYVDYLRRGLEAEIAITKVIEFLSE